MLNGTIKIFNVMLVKKGIKSGATSLNNRSIVSCSLLVFVYLIARDVTWAGGMVSRQYTVGP
jgi:hypothetical protein